MAKYFVPVVSSFMIVIFTYMENPIQFFSQTNLTK